jgi:hypothetical protein
VLCADVTSLHSAVKQRQIQTVRAGSAGSAAVDGGLTLQKVVSMSFSHGNLGT